MKKIILINLIFIGGFTSNKTTAQTKVNNDFKVHLTMAYEHYINLKAAFVKSEVTTVIAMAEEVGKSDVLYFENKANYEKYIKK